MRALVSCLCLALLAGTVAAQERDAASGSEAGNAAGPALDRPGASQATGVDDTRRICRTRKPPGSRVGGVTVCRTQAEWDHSARESRLAAEKAQMGANGGKTDLQP